jgi:hypothetical protein
LTGGRRFGGLIVFMAAPRQMNASQGCALDDVLPGCHEKTATVDSLLRLRNALF